MHNPYYPCISDVSFLAPAPDWWADSAFARNFPPRMGEPGTTSDPYPLTDWVSLIGAAGRGGHRADESILCPYTYGVRIGRPGDGSARVLKAASPLLIGRLVAELSAELGGCR